MKRFSVESVLLRKGTEKKFWLEEGFDYRTNIGKSGVLERHRAFHIHPFNTDLTSVPWWIQWRLERHGVYDMAAVVHDYLLQHRSEFPELSRKQIDRIFREACLDLGVPEYECKLLYAGVRMYSWWVEERHY